MTVQSHWINIAPTGDLNYSGIVLEDPASYPPFEFEIFDWKAWNVFMYQNQHYPIYTGLIYIPLIFGIQHVMKNRQPFDLKWELFLWNAALGIFSIVGLVRYSPEFLDTLVQPGGLYKSICILTAPNMPRLFWSMMFTLSKYVELGDTIFIVLRKKPLEFIQWYHHLMTLSVVWITIPYVEPIGRCYAVMNFGVHSLMYPYFALKALHYKVPRQVAKLITTLQLGQMFMGFFANTYAAYFYYYGPTCYRYPVSIKLFFVVYGSFIILFSRLFFKVVLAVTASKSKTD